MGDEAREAHDDESILAPNESEERRPRRDFFGALLFVAIAGAFIVPALRMPFKDSAWDWYAAPNIFPLAMAICLGTAALFVAVRGFVNWRANTQAVGPLRVAQSAREWGMPRFVAGAAMIAVLVWLLGKIDFYLLAPASIVVFGLAFRGDPFAKALKASVIAAAFIVAFLFVISRIFGIVFP